MGKDHAIGFAIFPVCLVLAPGYVVLVFAPQPFMSMLGLSLSTGTIHLWLIAMPVLIGFLTTMFIRAWIEWTMTTSPPPKAIVEQKGRCQNCLEVF